jgi:hypothetical protein
MILGLATEVPVSSEISSHAMAAFHAVSGKSVAQAPERLAAMEWHVEG